MTATRDRRIARTRLAAQRISASGFDDPAAVVRWMTAMQAQDLPGAKWSVGLRLPGSTEAEVDAALASGSIVRSWPLRGTLHLVASEDLGWILRLTGERSLRAARTRRGQLGLDEADLEKAGQSALDALGGGRSLARDELYAVFEQAGVPTDGQRGYHLLWHLAQAGVLCLGPPEGSRQRFVLCHEWIPRTRELERDEALGELAGRYFRSHGPAGIRDFAWWSSLTLGDARIGLAVARDSLEAIDRDGQELYFAPDAAVPQAKPDRLRLLPGFDEYLLGYQDRRPQLPEPHAARIVPGGNGVFLATIVRDGRVVGTWRRAKSSSGLVVDPEVFEADRPEPAADIRRAASAYARFLGLGLAPSAS